MRELISEDAARLIAATPISLEDKIYLRSLYEQEAFMRLPFLEEVLRKTPDASRDLEQEWASLPPEVQALPEWSFEKYKMAYYEHMQVETELFGEFPQKLKKWVIFYMPDYREAIAQIPFAHFRIDEVNAGAVKLPTGSSAVIINTTVIDILPIIASAYINLYNEAISEPGYFNPSTGVNSDVILYMAKLFAEKRIEGIVSGTHFIQTVNDNNILNRKGVEVSLYMAAFMASHECAHILLGHLNFNGASAELRAYNYALEYEADMLATKSLIDVTKARNDEYLVEFVAATAILFGFLQLVEEYRVLTQDSHPHPINRWANVRQEFIDAMETDLVVTRFDRIMYVLSMAQRFNVLGTLKKE